MGTKNDVKLKKDIKYANGGKEDSFYVVCFWMHVDFIAENLQKNCFV